LTLSDVMAFTMPPSPEFPLVWTGSLVDGKFWVVRDTLMETLPLPYYTPPPLSESVVSEMHVRTKFCYRQAITSCKYTENPRGVQLEGGYSRGGGHGSHVDSPSLEIVYHAGR
jgi:hypothetical protein